MKTSTRIVGVLATASLALAGFTGCGLLDRKPQNAEELAQKVAATKQDNFRITGELPLRMAVGPIEVPLDMDLDISVDGTNAHGTISSSTGNASMELYGTTTDDAILIYYKGVPFDLSSLGMGDTSSATSSTTWSVTETEISEDETLAGLNSILNFDSYDDVTFEETEDGYVVTVPGTAFSSGSLSGFTKEFSKNTGSSDDAMTKMVYNALEEGLKDTTLTITVGSDYRVTGLKLDPIKIELNLSEMMSAAGNSDVDVSSILGEDATLSYQFGFDLTFDDYGNVEAITIPEDVISNATPAEADLAA